MAAKMTGIVVDALPSGRFAGRARGAPTLGLFTHGAGDPNSHTVWAGVASVAQEHGANLICFPGKPLRSHNEFEAQANILYDLAGAHNLDGLIIWLSGLTLHLADQQQVLAFCRRYQPLPVVTTGVLMPGIPGVVVENYGGMRGVVSHLIETHDCRRIAFVSGPECHQEAQERYRGYLDALIEHGLPIEPGLVVEGNFKESGGITAVEVLLDERRARFDALVAASDNMAIGAMKTLQARGLRIPDDIAVAGLNDESQSALVTPPLTTAPLHFYEQARTAAEMVLALLRGEQVPEQVILPTQLLLRRSCGCPDPAVAASAEEPQTLAHADLVPFMSGHRDQIAAAMAGALEGLPSDLALQLAGQLLRAFAAEITQIAPGAFLSTLEEVLRLTGAAEQPISGWHGAVSALRREVLACAGQEAGRAESLWQQARVLIGETGQRGQAYQLWQAEEQARRLSAANQMLSTTVDRRSLADVLVEALPQLNIAGCYLALYDDPARPTESSQLVVAYDHRGRLDPGDRSWRFDSRWLVPDGLLPSDRRFSLVVEPLHFRADQLGFVLFEGNPQMEEVYEILRDQISGAIKRSQLIEHNLALYDEAVQARRAAEEGRRMAEEGRRLAEQGRGLAEAGRRLAEQADHLKSRFLATVSHELRTPLSLIVGTIEMMPREQLKRAGLPEPYLRDLNSIRASAQHLTHLIGDVLDLASSQAGELQLVHERLQLNELLHDAAMLGEPMARERGLAWQAVIPADLPPVYGDRTRLQQAVLNLIGNAVKFTEQGTVTLWAERGRKQVLIAVSDTGIGIATDEQDAIFDEFRQSERSTRRGYGGMGLGLAISRRLIELHGGKIGVLSSGTDRAGSTFYFTLPVMAPPACEWPAPPDNSQTVLLLCENAAGSQALADHLGSRGFQVEVREAGAALDWLEDVVACPPGAIILDYQPAAERGWEMMRVLKSHLATREVPVVFYALSAEENCGSVLAIDCLAKPIDADELVRVLERQGLAAGRSQEKTVLIVDDEPSVLALHARIVQSHLPDCRILRASNGIEALAEMANTLPDLVLLDLMMPEMDGFAVLEKMREAPRLREVPVIVLTAQILTHDDMTRLQNGVAVVLAKGLFAPAEVLQQIEAVLARNKRLGTETQRAVRLAMAYIHEHYAEPITRETLAEHLGMNERYLTRCFHEETGVPPITYLNRYRIREARTLLERGSTSITDIALATGFSDSSYFGRVFQKEVGVSPAAYRRSLRLSETLPG